MSNINYHIVKFKNITTFALRAVIEKNMIITELDEKQEARRRFVIDTFRGILDAERNLFSL